MFLFFKFKIMTSNLDEIKCIEDHMVIDHTQIQCLVFLLGVRWDFKSFRMGI